MPLSHSALVLLATSSLLALSGCGLVPKDPSQAAEPPEAPEQWSNPLGEPGGSPPLLTDSWVGSFDAPALEQLVSKGLASNFNLQALAANVEIARASARIEGADLRPTFSANFEPSWNRTVIDGPAGPISDTGNRFRLTAVAQWELDLWGRLRDGVRGATAEFEATQADLEAARLSLAGNLARGWFNSLAAQTQAALALEVANSFAANARTLEARYERGLIESPLDLRLVRASSESAAASAQASLRQADATLRSLETLVADYPSASLELTETLPGLPDALPALMPADLLDRRPDLIAAKSRLAASDARFSAARKARLPSFSLSAAAGTSSSKLDNLLDTDYGIWNLIGNLLAPLSQAGRIDAGILLAEARKNQALANYASTLLTAFQEVETALAAERLLKEELRRTENFAREAAAAEALAWERYERGLLDILTPLDTQRRAFEARSRLIALQNQLLNNRVNLYIALGGDYRSDTAPLE